MADALWPRPRVPLAFFLTLSQATLKVGLGPGHTWRGVLCMGRPMSPPSTPSAHKYPCRASGPRLSPQPHHLLPSPGSHAAPRLGSRCLSSVHTQGMAAAWLNAIYYPIYYPLSKNTSLCLNTEQLNSKHPISANFQLSPNGQHFLCFADLNQDSGKVPVPGPFSARCFAGHMGSFIPQPMCLWVGLVRSSVLQIPACLCV